MTSSIEAQETALTPAEAECLRLLAGHMIPASEAHGVPGADDPAILADMMTAIGRDRDALKAILALVDKAAGGRLADLTREAQAELLARMRADDAAQFAVVEAIVSRAYYRDDRVLASLGVEPRPPFPKGFEVEQVDLSLLEPVRRRGPIYRDAG